MIGLDDFAFECRAAAGLCRQVAAADLAGQAVYVVPLSALPDSADIMRNAISWAHHEGDLFLQPYLERAGIWQGRGFAITVRQHRSTSWPWSADAVALHELTHYLGRDSLTKQARLRAGIARNSPWEGHDASFVRTCIHLVYRAESLGVCIPLESVRFAGCEYGLRFDSHVYKASLGDEPARFAHKPIRWVLKQPPPPAFATLWKVDTRHRA